MVLCILTVVGTRAVRAQPMAQCDISVGPEIRLEGLPGLVSIADSLADGAHGQNLLQHRDLPAKRAVPACHGGKERQKTENADPYRCVGDGMAVGPPDAPQAENKAQVDGREGDAEREGMTQ